MEKMSYVEHILEQIQEKNWSGGYSNRPHWFLGDLTIYGETVTNPESLNDEQFTLIIEQKLFRKPRVVLSRMVKQREGAWRYHRIDLTDFEEQRLLDTIPFINTVVEERIASWDQVAAMERIRMREWP